MFKQWYQGSDPLSRGQIEDFRICWLAYYPRRARAARRGNRVTYMVTTPFVATGSMNVSEKQSFGVTIRVMHIGASPSASQSQCFPPSSGGTIRQAFSRNHSGSSTLKFWSSYPSDQGRQVSRAFQDNCIKESSWLCGFKLNPIDCTDDHSSSRNVDCETGAVLPNLNLCWSWMCASSRWGDID